MFDNLCSDYQIIYADPPWEHYGDQNRDAAAGKHYKLMSYDQLKKLPFRSIMSKRSALFCWFTFPRLDFCFDVASHWGLHYRGTPHLWVKVRKSDGGIIHGQGVRPTFTKPNAELLTVWTTNKRGRTHPLHSEKHPQIILEPRTPKHSEKPDIFRDSIVELCGDLKRIELFARKRVPGWDAWGDGL